MSRWDDALPRALAACGGFLLAVLWMDLMFDAQVLGGDPSASEMGSIRAYYRRVTLDAGAMSYLVGLVMMMAVVGAIAQAWRSRAPTPWRLVTPALVIAPVGLAAVLIFPDAQALAQSADPERQLELARRICYTHIGAFASVGAFVAVQISRWRT